jgi:TolA-binding protein
MNSRRFFSLHNFYIWFIIIASFCGIFFNSCSTPDHYYQPQSDAQKQFYKIRDAYDEGESGYVIDKGEEFIEKYPDHILKVAVEYYTACAYQDMRKYDKANIYFRDVIKNDPDSDWAKLSEIRLGEMKH